RQPGHGRPDRTQRDGRGGAPRRSDRRRPQRPRDRRSGRSRVHELHAIPQRPRPQRRSNRRLACRNLRPDVGGLGRRPDPRPREGRAGAARATVVDPTDIDLTAANNNELGALLCEFKSDMATYLQTYVHGTNPVSHAPYAQTLADLLAFDAAHPNLEGPWNDLIFQLADATNGRDGACAALRAATTPPTQDAVNNRMTA